MGLREGRKQSERERVGEDGDTLFERDAVLLHNMPDPAHSADEERFLVLGGRRGTGFSLSHTRSDRREHASSARAKPLGANAMTTKKARSKAKRDPDTDTIEPAYDFSMAVRGATAARYEISRAPIVARSS